MLRLPFFLAALSLANLAAAGENKGQAELLPEERQAFFATFCLKCHNAEQSKGEMTLDDLKGFADQANLPSWERVLEVLESGEMPPEEERQPSSELRGQLVATISEQLREQVRSKVPARNTAARRLTNIEYENTIRDLVGFRLELIDRLPKDPDQPYRFNNTPNFMRIGPEQIDRYLECARRAMASAIVDPEKPEVHKTRREWKPQGLDRGMGLDEFGIWGNRRGSPAGGMQLKSFPKIGEYRIRVQASAILPEGYQELPLRLVMGYGGLEENQSTHQIEPVGTIRLTNSPDDPRIFEFRGRIENHPVRPPRAHRQRKLPPSMTITPQNLFDDGTLNDSNDFSRTRNMAMPRVVINWLEFEGPLTETWPPEHHLQILFESPLRESNPAAYVKEVLQRFMSRAYRRPATKEEVERFTAIYDLVLPELKTLEAAMRETLAMVLISPQFLYQNQIQAPQYRLAAKLSYFLWASMPDEELLLLAAQGKLDDPAEIQRQVIRLLADKRAEDFVRTFTMQWLSLGKLHTVPINQDLYPRFLYYVPRGERAGTEEPYRPTIRDYMIEETVGFVGELLRGNKSLFNFVHSDFAYLNQPLAAHYGVENVHGIHFRPVNLSPEHRLGGLLTHGSILIGNGTGSAPHPIYRAVWLREAILGDEVADPPAEVPALSDSAGDSGDTALTIKDLLVKHRQVESCNDCHSRLDPWGIPFERYNAIGRYQPFVPKDGTRVSPLNSQHGDLAGYQEYLRSIQTMEVEAASKLPLGPEVDGMQELKDYLLEQRREDIAENVVRRLLAYSIGRELNVRDRFTVEELMAEATKRDFRLRDIIIAICQSETFRESVE
ncbi:MAG: DUF1592 domain-containing protein [Planctomycetota bacterium]|nr:DUF1592 domain-containing protein [Planctomycetota bacterium]